MLLMRRDKLAHFDVDLGLRVSRLDGWPFANVLMAFPVGLKIDLLEIIVKPAIDEYRSSSGPLYGRLDVP